VEEKATAAKSVGATTFLVPEGQGSQTYVTPQQECKRYAFITHCKTEYTTEKVDIGKNIGISVVEVSDIQQAIQYFFNP
jgi:predicted S18 family serine protease